MQFGNQYTRVSPLKTDSPSGTGGAGGGWTNPDAAKDAAGEGSPDLSQPTTDAEPATFENQEQGQQE